MDGLWPWLAVAGFGALHGLSPASGWMFAAAWGLRGRPGARVHQALPAIVLGHLASIALAALVVARGAALDRDLFQLLAGTVLIVTALHCLYGTGVSATDERTGHAGLALWSFLMSSAHGAGLMLMPALAPMCGAGGARNIALADSLVLALLALAVHLTAMLLTATALAGGVCHAIAKYPRLFKPVALRQAWPPLLLFGGALLVAAR